MEAHKILLTPPKAGTLLSELSPKSYLESPQIISPLKRKSCIDLTSHSKRLCLDPKPHTEHKTILDYFADTAKLLPQDRQKLHITADAVPILESAKKAKSKKKSLEADITCLKERERESAEKMESIQLGLAEVRLELAEVQLELAENTRRRAEENFTKLECMKSNFLEKVVPKVARKLSKSIPDAQNDPSHTKSRALQLVSEIEPQKLIDKTELGIPQYQVIRNFPYYKSLRNSHAHDTEKDFARLILSPQFHAVEYHKWAPFFSFYYDGKKTIEDVANEVTTEISKIDEDLPMEKIKPRGGTR